MIHDATTFQVLLYEGPGSQPLPADRKAELCRSLLDQGYGIATLGANALLAEGVSLVILGDFAGQPAPAFGGLPAQTDIPHFDLANATPESVLSALERLRGDRPMNQPGQWKPWFPVIDYSRCTNCMQCLSFCLFDVYGVSKEGKIQVQNNDNCKTNCPACSRVCPEVAIMFPKYASGPINGEPVNAADLQRESMKVDISALLGGDIYSRLRERSDAAKSRFSKERDASKALSERKKCLTKLITDGFIPADVLANLPSPEEIQRRAEAAAAKAQAALT
jgi:Pyruvate/2-oxoacid:ferredoxin oxidoreductase delta subunit